MRINKFLSQAGVCSRREADKLIDKGVVYVNGAPAVLGEEISEDDKVTVNGKVVSGQRDKIYLAFNKPKGIVCTAFKGEKNNIIDFLQLPYQVTYAGRLDKDSTGLLILTNDGDCINALMRGRYAHQKEYVVRINGEITKEKIQRLEKGIYLKEIDKKTDGCNIRVTGEKEFHITISQGLNRQIRRMCQAVELQVLSLKRIRIGEIYLGDLAAGQYRPLNEKEVDYLNRIKEQANAG